MAHPIVLDLETQFKFQEVGYDHKKLRVSVCGIYNYADDTYRAYKEDELPEVFKLLEHASLVIGFNIRKFDLPVLAPYYVGDILQFEMLDILEEVEKSLGHRIALDDLARTTLNTKKSGHGLMAIDFFREGKWQELIDYCLQDVKVTKEIYEYGKKNRRLYYLDHKGRREIPVSFIEHKPASSAVTLSLPF